MINACIMAGGFTDYAALKKVTVIRSNGKRPKIFKLDLNKVQAGKADDLVLRPGDRIDVPHRAF